MAVRPRNHWVNIPNLYCKLDKRNSKTYWQYRHPLTGQFIGFGTDQAAARLAASELNRLLAQQETAQSFALIDMVSHKKINSKKSIRMRVWIDLFKEAQHAGEVEPGYNPALATRKVVVRVSRSCLNLEMWKAIFEAASTMAPYVQNSMLLAVVTGRGAAISPK